MSVGGAVRRTSGDWSRLTPSATLFTLGLFTAVLRQCQRGQNQN
jgi:hypothetical protein